MALHNMDITTVHYLGDPLYRSLVKDNCVMGRLIKNGQVFRNRPRNNSARIWRQITGEDS